MSALLCFGAFFFFFFHVRLQNKMKFLFDFKQESRVIAKVILILYDCWPITGFYDQIATL